MQCSNETTSKQENTMMRQAIDSPLRQAIEQAWKEVNQHPQHKLRVQQRLHLYDTLIGDLSLSIGCLVNKGKTSFPERTLGLKRYVYLGILTVKPLFAAWEGEINRLIKAEEDMEPVRLFPYDMLNATQQLLSGKTKVEINFKNEYWVDISNWHYIVGNLSEDTLFQHGMFLRAVHRVYLGAEGWLPLRLKNTKLTDQTYDEELDIFHSSHGDFCYYALESNICEDPNEPGWDKPRSLPIKRNWDKALKFWEWWLFEAIPQAATTDFDQLG